MTLLQMECFLNAAKFQSYSLAANNLYISQPTLSRQLQALEDELNVTLFIRSNNRMCLTAIGQKMLPKIELLFQSFRNTTEQLQEMVGSYSGRLRIGVQAGNSLDHRLRSGCQYLMQEHPEASILVCHQKQKSSYAALMDEQIDMLMALNLTMPPSDKLDSLTLYEEHMCLAVPADHPNANLPYLRHEEINHYFPDLKLYCIDTGEFDVSFQPPPKKLDDAVRDRAISLSGVYADNDTLMMMVDAGLGMAFLHSRVILSGNQKVRLIPTTPPPSSDGSADHMDIRLYWQQQNANPLLHEFLHYVRNIP